MTNSPLVAHTRISPNKTSPRKAAIDTISIHCAVGQVTAEGLGSWFAQSSVAASSNYCVDKDGRVGMYVEEKDRSWCTSSPPNDHRAVTIEVASDDKHPYAVTDAAFNGLLRLVTDICKRNGIKKLVWKDDKNLAANPDPSISNLTVHRWFASKECPGQYLLDRHPLIVEEVNGRLGANTAPGNFGIGDIVQFGGGGVYYSANSTIAATTRPASICKVTATYSGLNPYHLISEDDKGVYGWARAADVSAYVPPPPKPPEEVTVDNAIAAGIIAAREYWLEVLMGTVTPSRGNVKALMDNAVRKANG